MSKTQRTLRQTLFALTIACALAPLTHAQAGPGKGYETIPAGAYSVVAEVHARPGKEKELLEATLPLIELVRSDPKNLVYFLQVDRNDPAHLIFYEVFATQADFESHNAMPYVKSWFTKLPDLADGGVKVLRMEVIPPPAKP